MTELKIPTNSKPCPSCEGYLCKYIDPNGNTGDCFPIDCPDCIAGPGNNPCICILPSAVQHHDIGEDLYRYVKELKAELIAVKLEHEQEVDSNARNELLLRAQHNYYAIRNRSLFNDNRTLCKYLLAKGEYYKFPQEVTEVLDKHRYK